MQNYSCIKEARIEEGVLSGSGYALGENEVIGDGEVCFSLTMNSRNSISFVFSFTGAGSYVLCELIPDRDLVVLSRIKDGIKIYLQHASVDLTKEFPLQIRWSSHAYRLFSEGQCFINVLSEGLNEGRWGFVASGKELQLPRVEIVRSPSPQFKWVILGDGYSNNRWQNRHFYSWPELVFGHQSDYLNACVGAGNTIRVKSVVEQIASTLNSTHVLIAAGADDFIESATKEGFALRLKEIVIRIKELGADSITLCSIPPRAVRDDDVGNWNLEVKSVAEEFACGFLDFHSMLKPQMDRVLVHGDYPGAKAQELIGLGIIESLGLSSKLSDLRHKERKIRIKGVFRRVAYRILGELKRELDVI